MADTHKYESLAVYAAATETKKYAIAAHLGVSQFQMAALLYPRRYRVTVDDDLARSIASLLNQPISYVRKLYPKAA